MEFLWQALLFLFFVVVAAVFAAIEVSLISISRLRARSLFKMSMKGSESLLRLKENPRRLLITILVWSNIASITASSLAAVYFTQKFGPDGIGLSVVAMTFILVIFGEIAPKVMASSSAERLALWFAPYVEWLVKLSIPAVLPLEHLARRFTYQQDKSRRPLLTEDELKAMLAIAVEEGSVGANEADLVRDALDFNDQIVMHVMTPARDIEFFRSNWTVETALAHSSSSRHHRFPVSDSAGRVVGMVNDKLLLDANNRGRGGIPLSAVMLSPLFVKKNAPISSVFSLFQKRKRKMAIVREENGTVLGLISIEDIVEELIDEMKNLEGEALSSQPLHEPMHED